MKLVGSKLFIEITDLVKSGFKAETLYGYVSKNYQTLPYIKQGGVLLFPYEDLGKTYKEAIEKTFGKPYDYVLTNPIRDQIVYNTKAEAYYLEAGCKPEDAVKLSKSVSMLDLIVKLYEDKKAIKTLCGTLDNFFSLLIKIIQVEGIELPTSYKRLISSKDSALKRYKEQGFAALIHGNTGKSNAAKLTDDTTKQQLIELLKHENNYDDVAVTWFYNQWATKAGYKEISVETVTAKRREWAHLIAGTRNGLGNLNDKYIRQVKRLPAKTMHPLTLVECDDYNINYYFKGEDGNPFNRYVSYIVADSATGLLLGKSYRVAQSPTFDMVKLAWLDAMHYIKELTGDWHLPNEVKADHWQSKLAHPFFKQIGKFVAPGIGNKHRGYIEQLFGSAHVKRCEKIPAHEIKNYNGNNLTATNRGVNVEAIKLYEKQRPTIGVESDSQIEQFVWLWRNLPAFTKNNMNAPSKEQEFKERWANMPNELKRPINKMQMLMRFGFVHAPQGRSINITNRGIEPIIGGIKYSYDLPDYNSQVHLVDRAKVNVVFDPYDMSEVLITDFAGINFIAKHAEYGNAALANQSEGSRTILNKILEEKKQLAQDVYNFSFITEADSIDPKAILLNGYQPKEVTAKAEQAAHERKFERKQLPAEEVNEEFINYHRNKINLNDYQ